MKCTCEDNGCPVSGRAQQLQHSVKPVVRNRAAPHDEIEQIVIGKRQQFLEPRHLPGIQRFEMALIEFFQYEIEFQQTAPAMPSQLAQFAMRSRGEH